MKRILNIIAFVLVTSYLMAIEPYYFKIDKLKGLPSNTVYDAYQDSKGFMWFAGSFGLCRFDGELFQNYNIETQSSKSGSGITEDKFGRIWYCNFDGQLFYVEQGKMQQFKQGSLFGYHRFAVLNNELVVIEQNEIAMYDLQNLKKKRVLPIVSTFVSASYTVDSVFYVYAKNLYQFKNNGKVTVMHVPSKVLAIQKGALLSELNGKLIIASKYYSSFFILQNNKFEQKSFSHKEFVQNICATKNETWFCTTNGIIQLDTTNKSNQHINIQYLEGNNVSDVLMDKDGHYWVSTLDKGVRFVPNINNSFLYTADAPTALELIDKQNILFGKNAGGIGLFNSTSNKKNPFINGNANHSVYYLYSDSLAGLIFSTSNTFRINDKKGNLIASSTMAVKSVAKINVNRYACAATGSCGTFTVKNGLIFQYLITDVRGKSTVYNRANNTIYFATNKGLYSICDTNTMEIKYKNELVSAIKLVNVDDKIYGLTTNREIFSINNKNQLSYIDLSELLNEQKPTNIITSQHRIFLFTRYSVYEFEPQKHNARKLLTVNLDFELNDIICWNEKLIVATNNGFIVVDSNQSDNLSKPTIYVDSIWLNNMKIDGLKIPDLAYNKKNITLFFPLLNYDSGNEPLLNYRINNADWITVNDNRRTIELTNLSAGEYSVEFMFGNLKTAESKSFEFIVDKPYWLKPWFIVLSIFLLLSFLYLFDRWRTATINRKSQEVIDRIELEKLANMAKLKALKSQMNPHFFFNALNTIQSFILENDKKMAVTMLGKFSNLTRSMLEMSEKDEVSVAEEMKILALYLDIEKVRFDDDFEYEILTNGFDTDALKIPALLLQPYIENAIKHGLLHKEGHKKLLISFRLNTSELLIVIDDNGIGRKRSMELNALKNKNHTSYATQAIEKRVKLLNEFAGRKISVEYIDEALENGRVHGTTVVIKIPVSKT